MYFKFYLHDKINLPILRRTKYYFSSSIQLMYNISKTIHCILNSLKINQYFTKF